VAATLLLPVEYEALASVCRKYQVRELAVFGSAARGEQREGSDIDLLVEFEPDAKVGFLHFLGLAEELEILLRRKVDLVPKAGLKTMIRERVLAEARTVYAA
jgi:predicted nucleotidyltransferase